MEARLRGIPGEGLFYGPTSRLILAAIPQVQRSEGEIEGGSASGLHLADELHLEGGGDGGGDLLLDGKDVIEAAGEGVTRGSIRLLRVSGWR